MGLNAQTAAGASYEIPVANVAVSTSSSGVAYTVPSGRYFKGWVGGTSGQYGIKVGNATIMKNIGNNNLPQPQGIDITLFAGQTVSRGGSGEVWVVGVEYNIDT